jgi:hypothetical protein
LSINRWLVIAGFSCLPGFLQQSHAAPILFDWGFNVSGAVYTFAGPPLPSSIDASGFNFNTGLGNVKISFTPGAPGNYFIDAFFDHDLQSLFGNEIGTVTGTAAAGQTWQIDEPGAGALSGDGHVIANFFTDGFDNTNHIASNPPFDAALGMGFHFALTAGQTAAVAFSVTATPPPTGFYLSQIDPNDPTNRISLSGNLDISGGGQPTTPEPSSVAMVVLGAALMLSRRRLRAPGR